jgi:hypothetical protein
MTLIMTGIALFVTAAVIANILQSYFKYRYETTPLIFIAIFLTPLGIASLFITQVSLLLLHFQIVIIAVLYITTIILLARFWQPMQNLYGSHTVPAGYKGLIKPKLSGQVVKMFEVALQDTSAWLIVGGLFLLPLSFIEVAVIFTVIVTILHVPGLWVFGKVYGGYFLIMSTALAFLVPLFYTIGLQGFLYLFALHLGGYVIMYMLMGYWGKNNVIK